MSYPSYNYMNGKKYPMRYVDPDITDAENLLRAAYHLAEAGLEEDAEKYIAQLCKLFKDVPINRKIQTPAKVLGEVNYLKQGVLRLYDGRVNIEMPAPPYADDDEEKTKAGARRNLAKRAADAGKYADLGWFSLRQAAGALAEKPPNTATFRPAVILSKIISVCTAYNPDMPAEAALVLSDKLKAILDKNPLCHDRWTTLRRDLHHRGSGRYSYSDDSRMGFAYLTESNLKIASDIMARDGQNQTEKLRSVSEEIIKWEETKYKVIHELYSAVDSPSDALKEQVKFFKMRSEQYEQDKSHFYHTPAYTLGARINKCFGAMQDVNDLIRCHAALCRHPDEYLHKTLIDCKMISEELDKTMPEKIWIAAGFLMSFQMIRPSEYDETQDMEIAREAIKAVAAIAERQNIAVKMDSPLLHPVSETQATEGDDNP